MNKSVNQSVNQSLDPVPESLSNAEDPAKLQGHFGMVSAAATQAPLPNEMSKVPSMDNLSQQVKELHRATEIANAKRRLHGVTSP